MIKITNRVFTNPLTGQSASVYKSNAGDIINCQYTIEEQVYFANVNGVNFTIDQVNNKIYISGGSWTLGGLLVGDSVKMYHGGASYNQTVVSVTSTDLELNDIHNFINQGDFLEIEGFTGTARKHVNLFVNHAFENAGFTLNSHIDLEKTGFKADNILTSGSNSFVQFGNQSGQFKVTAASIINKVAVENGGEWYVNFTIINSGIYAPEIADPLQDFHLNFGIQFFRVNANPNTAELLIDNHLSNIGYFNMGYADEPADGVISIPSPALTYNDWQAFTVNLTGVSSNILGIGGSYVPLDDNYFKNKPINQSELGMTVGTSDVSNIIVGINNFAAGTPQWAIEVMSSTYNAGAQTLSVDLEWNPAFNGFMNNKEGDRLFRLWIKTGNTNHLIYDAQLIEKPAENTELTPDLFQVVTFEEQITTPISNANEQARIEDNLAMLVKVPIVQNSVYQSIKALVYLEKTATNEQFIFQSQNFSLANNVYPNGFYVGNQSFQVNNNLASGSVKNHATLTFTNPVGVNYTAIVNYPFLINWRYWIQLGGMFSDFYPDINNNWLNYIYAGFKFWMEVQLVNPDGTYQFTREELTFIGYDTDGKVDCNFVLKKADGTGVSHIIDEQMTIEVTHTGTTVTPTLSALKLEFTIEPKQGQPRWQVSTEYSETNPNNPLTILSNIITAAGVAKSIITIDTTKIDISGGVSFSSEIKGLCGVDPILNRHKEDYEYLKLPNLGDSDESRCGESCCELQLKVASLTDSSPEKNDTTAIYYKTDEAGGSLAFTIWKNGVSLTGIAMSTTVFEPLGRFGMVDWQAVMQYHGAGCYEIKYQGVIGSIPFIGTWGKYQLLEYSCDLVQSNVRIRTYFDKFYKKDDINFKGTNLFDDVRFNGVFGDMQPKQKSEILLYGDDYQRLVEQENRPEYRISSKLIDPALTRLTLKNLLMATDIFVSEYNPLSPDFMPYENVILTPESAVEFEYGYGTRKRGLNILVSKKMRNDRIYRK